MENIFENAYFGKAYKTRNGEVAIYSNYDGDYDVHRVLLEGGHLFSYDKNGHVNMLQSSTLDDIVSEWQEPIDEEELDRLALKENPNSEHSGDTYESGLFYGFDDGFKAGVRYMKNKGGKINQDEIKMNKDKLIEEIKCLEDKLYTLRKQLYNIQAEEKKGRLNKFQNTLEGMVGKYYAHKDEYGEEYVCIITCKGVDVDSIDGEQFGILETLAITETGNDANGIIHSDKEFINESDLPNYTEIPKSDFMKMLIDFTDGYFPKD